MIGDARHRRLPLPLLRQVVGDTSQRGPLVGVSLQSFNPFGAGVPRECVRSRMDIPGMRHGSDQCALIENFGRSRQMFADQGSWNRRSNRREITPNFAGCSRLGIKRIQLTPRTVNVQKKTAFGSTKSR